LRQKLRRRLGEGDGVFSRTGRVCKSPQINTPANPRNTSTTATVISTVSKVMTASSGTEADYYQRNVAVVDPDQTAFGPLMQIKDGRHGLTIKISTP
jgi:hypothetical protein